MPEEEKKINKGSLETKLKSYRASEYYENRLGDTSLLEILHYSGKYYPGQIEAFLIKAVREFIGMNIVSDVLFMAFGLLQGYEEIAGIGERRRTYLDNSDFLSYFYKDEYEIYKKLTNDKEKAETFANFIENLRKKEDRYIKDLTDFIAKVEDISVYADDIDGYAIKVPTQNGLFIYMPALPKPSYELSEVYEELPSIAEIQAQRKIIEDISSNKIVQIDEKLDKQNKLLDELHNSSRERDDCNKAIETLSEQVSQINDVIAEYTKITPAIADGVNEANITLNDLLALVPKVDFLHKTIFGQAKSSFSAIVYSLLGENISEIDSIEYEQIVNEVKDQIYDLTIRAVLSRLPDDDVDEFTDIMDNTDVGANDLMDLLGKKVIERNLDVDAIQFDTLVRYIESFKKNSCAKQELLRKVRSKKEIVEVTLDEAKLLSNSQINSQIKEMLLILDSKYNHQYSFNNAGDAEEWGSSLIVNPIVEQVQSGKLVEAYSQMKTVFESKSELTSNIAFMNLFRLLIVKIERDDNLYAELIADFMMKEVERYDSASTQQKTAISYSEAIKKYSVDILRARIDNALKVSSNPLNDSQELMQNILDEFVHVLIGEHAHDMSTDELEQLHSGILSEIDVAISKSVFYKLPDEALDEIEKADENGEIDVFFALNKQIAKYNIDVIEITSVVLLNFLRNYMFPSFEVDMLEREIENDTEKKNPNDSAISEQGEL